ncbi:Stf0 family sulfotransferase [Piscinibacter sp.]|uniref:Stf0 family sulfotransferase n=1 Tax=Piscinibacter sp. TaxID=1903157 RepID=UPI002CF0F698|nr:Stf0 family sulfotransferase [Albitalea sp.]HUG21862.1 Stf0 family sulfotransferase [Albitalea sp.]
MNLYEDQFSAHHDLPPAGRPSKVFVIASTPRSGSHMLGHGLHETGRFGFPLEYANAHNLAEWKRRLDVTDTFDALRKIEARRTSPNGVFSIKVHYAHLKRFGGFRGLADFYPGACYVLLSRKNVLRQAISCSIAAQTGVWIDGQAPNGNTPHYRFRHIDARLREAIRDTASWRYELAANGVKYIEIDFDFAKHNIPAAIERIADFMGVELDPQSIPQQPVTRAQSDALNDEWERRFVADHRGSVLFEPGRSSPLDLLKWRLKRLLSTSPAVRTSPRSGA